MSSDKSSHKDKDDVIGKWSEDKLQLLEKYLKAYSDIMNSQKQEWLKAYYYIDAFAGSVKPKAKSDEERFIAGSPLRALQCEPPFDDYWFIELSSWRVGRLKELQKQFPHLKIDIWEGDSNEILCKKVIPEITMKSKQRGLVFLDPFGLQVDFETVKALAKANTFDLFVNFPIMAITRILKREKSPTVRAKTLLNKVFGNTDWIQVIYKPSPQLPLFGDQIIKGFNKGRMAGSFIFRPDRHAF
jgi:three-Cys-motif partner protein